METLFGEIGKLLVLVNQLTPLAVIALLVGVLYVQLWKQPSKQEFETVKDNHLHDLPTIAANTTAMVDSLRRLEISQTRIETKIDSWTE